MQALRSVRRAPARSGHAEGTFLLSSPGPNEVFTPDDLTEEQRLIADSSRRFFNSEISPQSAALEDHRPALIRELMKKAGSMGFLSTEIPEQDGGLGIGLVAAMLQVEQFARHMSFGMAIVTHSGIGTLPIVLFGSEYQKRRYLPEIMSGQMISAFALTEAQSGSDALSARTTATLDSTGEFYELNGQKMWVTNGGIADVFIVFAKVDGTRFTAFLVERYFEGVSLGPEESKMGMRGSSTRPLILDHVRVPVANVLGEVGQGHRVAFGTLNICRTKLGAGLVGASKEVLGLTAEYSTSRTAFGNPLADFELIQEKLARMASSIYAAESVVYRTAGLIDKELHRLKQNGWNDFPHGLGFGIESSIAKVFTTEVLDQVADEGVQIHGCNGYSAAFAVERFYRDSRVNRIFEGTNEIHRLLITERLIKLAGAGLPLFDYASAAVSEASRRAPRAFLPRNTISMQFLGKLAERARQVTLILLAEAHERFGDRLRKKQLLLASLSDSAIETYAIQSVIARTLRAIEAQEKPADKKVRPFKQKTAGLARLSDEDWGNTGSSSMAAQTRAAATALFVRDSFNRIGSTARTAAGMINSARPNSRFDSLIEHLIASPPFDRASLCAKIAESTRESKGYAF